MPDDFPRQWEGGGGGGKGVHKSMGSSLIRITLGLYNWPRYKRVMAIYSCGEPCEGLASRPGRSSNNLSSFMLLKPG